jgi:hypothetical protein
VGKFLSLNESFWILNKQTNKIDMKNKLISVIASLGMVASASAVKVNNNLSINGFIDGSYQQTDLNNATTTMPGNSAVANSGNTPKDQALGVDEVELNFITNVGNVDGVINIDSHDGLDAVEVEQAHITYSLDNGVSFTLGKYGSGLGFEREDPTSLYTFSRAYSLDTFNLGNVDANVVEGLTVAYSSDVYSIAASFENALSTDAEDDELNLELSFSYTGINNVTLGGGYFFDNQSDSEDETDVLNLHASTSFGKLFLAAEYTELSRGANVGDGSDLDGYLVLADYDFNDKLGVAVRVSSNELSANSDYSKVTLAPNYAITESLGAIVEYSDVENAGTDSNEFAIEFLYTF